MNTKRIIALLAALLMIVALFAGCGNDSASKGSDSGTKDTAKTDDKAEDKKDDDTPDDSKELYTTSCLTWGDSTKVQIPREQQYYNYVQMNKEMENYGFILEPTQVELEVYVNTLNSLQAAKNMPDTYFAYGKTESDTLVGWIENGLLLKCSEVMECSTGNMTRAFEAGGEMEWARSVATYTDGDWYYVMVSNSTGRSIRIHESDGPLRIVTQVHGAYSVMIRQDWLDILGLDIPDNTEDFYQACLRMNTEDTNGNGLNDERIAMGLGTEYQYQGVGQWFGMPYVDFREDPSTGKIEVGMLTEGFAEWVAYLNKFYNDGLIYNNEGGHPWEHIGNLFPENNIIAYTLMQDNLWNSGKSQTGVDTCNYEPTPVIAALENVKPRLIGQEGKAGEVAVGFNSASCTPDQAACFVDFMYSYELFMLYYYGIEGKSYEYLDDGTIDDYTAREGYVKGDIEEQYMPMDSMPDNKFLGLYNYFPTSFFADLWDYRAKTYEGYQEALDAGEPYAQNGYDEARWQSLNSWDEPSPCNKMMNYINDFGEENINWACYYDYATLPTLEENAIQREYGTDLKTYLVETAANLVMGKEDIANLQSFIDYANDNLGLQEYIEAQQGRVDRFMNAMGLYD